ncbi:DUF6773 family protein [Sporosarcina sp. 6E9]|uniref:DUF6773 family protein n=1 Tax=Sporosarcina sp. 6E9 TaxID=2819235 RepID=UPI001B3159AA|nr:DUF6773 family protein [Sporosarcina sp. 6E9]
MINSFINKLLPKDEYNRLSSLYFFAESALIVLIVFICLTIVQLFFYDLSGGLDLLLLCVTFFMIIYPTTRYVLSGMEHDDVMDESSYEKSRKKGMVQTMGTGALFFIFLLTLNLLRNDTLDMLELIIMPITFTIIYGVFTIISLKKSYNKNKDLDA